MLTYKERVEFDYNSYANVYLNLYGDDTGQGEIYIYDHHVLAYHVIVCVEGKKVSSYTETPRHVIEDAPCDIQRMIAHVANAMRAIMGKGVDFNDLH